MYGVGCNARLSELTYKYFSYLSSSFRSHHVEIQQQKYSIGVETGIDEHFTDSL